MPSSPKTLVLGPAEVRWTDARHGSFASSLPDVDTFLFVDQIHGNDVVIADQSTPLAIKADALVTVEPDLPLAIGTADCAPIALVSHEGVVGAVHAGWRGLASGVVANTLDAMRELGATIVFAALGPCIHSDCYEFNDHARLEEFAELWGVEVMGVTSTGSPSFDLVRAVEAELASEGVALQYIDNRCTACDDDLFSYRKTRTEDRQVMIVTRYSTDRAR